MRIRSRSRVSARVARPSTLTATFITAAIAGTVLLGSAMTQPAVAGTYNYVFPGTAGSTVDWMTPSAWTLTTGTPSATNYPGGDATEVDDAVLSFVATTSAGLNNITLSSPLANSIGNLTMTLQDTTSTDQLNLVLNANLTVNGGANLTGGSTGSSNRGLVTMTSAVGTTLNVGGVLSLGGANGNGSANTLGFSLVTINGNATLGGLTLRNDASKAIVSATAGTVNLGNVTLIRTIANGTATSAGGLHLLGGTVTANNFLVGSGDSSAVVEVNGANLTVNGSFIVGNNSAASARLSTVFQTLGNVNAANTTLFLGSSAVGTVGVYALNNGSLSVAGMQLTNAGGSANNKANFTMANGTLLNVGTGGIGTGSGTYTFTNNGGTIAATGSFTSTANTVITNTATFQAADASSNNFNMTFSGAISGAGNISKTGGGNLTLSGNNTYTGTTTVTAGRLIVSNTAAASSGTGTGAVTITNASLAGAGTIAGDVSVSSTSHVSPGVNNVGTLNFGGNVAIASGAVLDFDFNSSANSLINITNATKTLTLGSDGINLFAEGTTNPFSTNGTYNLIQVAGTVPSIAGLSILNGVPGVTYTLGTSAHDVTLTITGGTGATGWAHDVSGSWGNAANWNGGIPSGTIAILGNVLTAPRTVTLDGDRSITGLNLNSPFGYTIAQGSGGNLTLDNGASTAAISDFAGPHVISAPVILNSATSVSTTNPTDTLTISGVIGGAGSLSVAGPGTLILTNTANTFTGGITNTGNLQVGSGAASGSLGAGAVVNSGVLSFNSSSNMTITTPISGAGGITQNGTGVVTISGANTYTGTTTINSGILQYGTTTALNAGNINVVAPGKLDLNGLSVVVNTLTGNGTVDNLLTGSNVSLTFNGGSPTFNGTIQNTAGNLTVISSVTGRTTLGGTSTYSGGTNVTTGTLAVTANNALGTGLVTLTSTSANTLLLGTNVVLPNNISLNDGSIEFADILNGGTTGTFAGNITTVGSTQYRLGNSNTTSTLVMTGNSTVGTGITLITRGNVIFQGNGSLIVSNNSISVGRSGATAVVSLTVQDNAVLRAVGINLGGLNSTSDDLTNTITLSGNGTLDAGTGAFSLNNNNVGNSSTPSTVTLTTNDNSTVRGSAFTMTGSSTHTSTFWLINGGNIVASASNANFMPANSTLTVELAAAVNINDGGFNIGIAQPLLDFGGGAINKTGNGSLTLSGANTYGSGTTVLQGALYAANASAVGTGGVVVNNGATFGAIGVFGNSLTLNAGSHLSPGAGATIGTMTLPAGVTIGSGSTIDYNFKVDGSAASLLELQSGSISHAGGSTPIDLYVAGTTTPFAVNGNYTLVQFDGGFVNPNFSVADPVAGASYAFSQSGNNLVLTITGGLTSSVWAIDSNGSWNSSGSWTGGIPNSVSATATFGGIITAARTVTLDGNDTVGTINFANANAYTVNQGTGGNLTLDNGTNAATINQTLGSHTLNVPMVLNSNTTASAVTGTTLTLSGNISGAGILTTSGAGNVALSGANSFAGLTSAGTGTTIVSGANTYSGPTTITTGKIQLAAGGTLGNGLSALSIASAGTLDLNGQSATVGSLTGAGTIDNVAGAGASVLTTGGLNANVSFSGVIKNTTGTVALNKTGTGNLTLTGNSSYSGGTTLTSGGLYVNNTAGSGLGNGTVSLNGGTLGGTGTISAAVTGGSGAHSINPGATGAGSVGKLTVASLTTNANTTLAFDLSSPAGTSDVLAVSGAVTLNGGNLAITSQTTTGNTSLGYYKVLTYTGTLTGSTSGIVLPAVTNNVAYTLDTTHDANTIDVHRGFVGDATDDGVVDLNDLNVVLNHLGVVTSSWNNGNFDGAATIDLNDLNAVLNHLGTNVGSNAIVSLAESLVAGTASPAATPEPASLGLLALGAAALITRRRKA